MIWMPSDEQIAQTCHFFIATTIVFGATILGAPLLMAYFLVFVWALPKEFIFDTIVESDTFVSSCKDFTWYCIGDIVAILLLSLVKG